MNKTRFSTDDLENNIVVKSPKTYSCNSFPRSSPNAETFSPTNPPNSDHQQCCQSSHSKEELAEAEEERNFCGSEESRLLKFSIESILQPDFGKNSSNERSCFPPLEFPSTPSFSSPEICCNISSILPPSTPLGFQSHELLPSWIFCTRYSDRPSSGPRIRKIKRREMSNNDEEKRPRTAFTAEQLERLKSQFLNNRYLTEKRRQELAHELGLNESQIKIWFQNKRAKLKKSSHRTHQSASAVLHQLMAQQRGGGGIFQQK